VHHCVRIWLIDISSSSSPPKKAAKSKQPPKASKPASTVAKPSNKTPPAAPASNSNRDSNGDQEVFWLLKAEPLPRYENGVNVAFSIDDLKACTEPEPWSGVRNPQARNNMQAMRKGDLGFFYHSNAKPSGVVGILRVVEEAKVDTTAFDSKDPYYDPKSDKEKPKWYCVGVEFVKKFDDVVDLAKIKSHTGSGEPLEGMQLVNNSRLSVCRVRKEEWNFILELAGEKDAKRDAKTEEKTEED
jgi:predicted RNA-binding protein with PUA-like domain